MSEEVGSAEAGKSHKGPSERAGAARLYMTLAKLVEYISRVCSEMDAAKIEKGLNGESLDDLREAMGNVSLHAIQLWRPIINDLSEWEERGTPQEVFAVGLIRRYTAGTLGLLEEGEEDPRPRLTEGQQDRVLNFLLGQESAISWADPAPNSRRSAPRSRRSLLKTLRTFLTIRKARR